MNDPDPGQRGDGTALRRLELARLEGPNARWIVDNFDRFLIDASERGQPGDLLRYLGLPHTPGRIKRWLRDQWLARAAAQIKAPGLAAWTGCIKLADEWDKFVSLGVWLNSKQGTEPPAEILSELRRALWWASHYDVRTRLKGQPLSASGLFAIDAVTSAFSDKN